ncbi:hypothetical protein QQF64_021135 [Cirrhinus molitorella]|uniref:Uncharacterized protein n=1 Tax=Cirrhinus molitorella TaxID=172907 RepID=A0ABR3LB44_9TELE
MASYMTTSFKASTAHAHMAAIRTAAETDPNAVCVRVSLRCLAVGKLCCQVGLPLSPQQGKYQARTMWRLTLSDLQQVDGLPLYIFPDVVLLKHWLSGVEQTGDERGDDSEIKRRTGRTVRTEKKRERELPPHDCNLARRWAFTQIQQNAKRQKKVERRGGWDIRGLQAPSRSCVCQFRAAAGTNSGEQKVAAGGSQPIRGPERDSVSSTPELSSSRSPQSHIYPARLYTTPSPIQFPLISQAFRCFAWRYCEV